MMDVKTKPSSTYCEGGRQLLQQCPCQSLMQRNTLIPSAVPAGDVTRREKGGETMPWMDTTCPTLSCVHTTFSRLEDCDIVRLGSRKGEKSQQDDLDVVIFCLEDSRVRAGGNIQGWARPKAKIWELLFSFFGRTLTTCAIVHCISRRVGQKQCSQKTQIGTLV